MAGNYDAQAQRTRWREIIYDLPLDEVMAAVCRERGLNGERCEHGVVLGDWCEDCNKAYKEARHEAGYEEAQGVQGVRPTGPEVGQGSESGSSQAGGETQKAG